MTVSVVLPTHNRAGLLGRAIVSVLGQTLRDLELIVVDDASTDNTREVVAAVQDPRVRYVSQDRTEGPSAARNRGIALARGDWIAFQDSDDEWLSSRLERQLAAVAGYEGVALVVTNTTVTGGYPAAPQAPACDGRVRDFTGDVALWVPGTPTWLASRAALQRLRGFAEDLVCHEDWELALRLVRDGGRVLLVNDALVTVGAAPDSLYANERSRFESLRRVVERHRDYLRARPEAWAYYSNAVGQGEARFGSMAAARRNFAGALRARPFALRGWANLVASLGGAGFFEKYVTGARAVARAARGRPA